MKFLVRWSIRSWVWSARLSETARSRFAPPLVLRGGASVFGDLQRQNRYAEWMQMVFIGMGSNLASPAGDPEATLAAAAERLGTLGRLVGRSSIYSTEPAGFADQPRFLNAVVALETDLNARRLLEGLLQIEKEFGRNRSAGIRNGPRTLDLDILVYGDERISEPGLEIPHPRMRERDFVVVPLVELASNDPTAPGAIRELLRTSNKEFPGRSDAIIAVQSAVWRARPLGGAGDSGAR